MASSWEEGAWQGLVQRPMRLTDGSAVRLTVQKYYTPSDAASKPYDDELKPTARRNLNGLKMENC